MASSDRSNCAVIEACDVTRYGEIVLTSSVGAAPTFCRVADKIIVELNRYHPAFLRGVHDIYEPLDPPQRSDIPLFKPADRVGQPVIQVDPAKILAWWKSTNPTRRRASTKWRDHGQDRPECRVPSRCRDPAQSGAEVVPAHPIGRG